MPTFTWDCMYETHSIAGKNGESGEAPHQWFSTAAIIRITWKFLKTKPKKTNARDIPPEQLNQNFWRMVNGVF